MARSKKRSKLEDMIIKGLMAAAEAESRQKLNKEKDLAAFQKERDAQIKEFRKNIRGAKVWKPSV